MNANTQAGGSEKELTVAMVGIYQRSLKETGVNHSYFLRMLNESGGHATAVHLVHANQPSDGYTDLHLKGRLDLTVEALILQPRWESLFEQDTRDRARTRLIAYGFDFGKHGLASKR